MKNKGKENNLNQRASLLDFLQSINVKKFATEQKSWSNSTPIAYHCEAPSTIRKPFSISRISAFISSNQLPFTVVDTIPMGRQFQITINSNN